MAIWAAVISISMLSDYKNTSEWSVRTFGVDGGKVTYGVDEYCYREHGAVDATCGFWADEDSPCNLRFPVSF
jgi:hypothetical protein